MFGGSDDDTAKPQDGDHVRRRPAKIVLGGTAHAAMMSRSPRFYMIPSCSSVMIDEQQPP